MPTPGVFHEQRQDMLMLETHKATTAFFDRLLLVNCGTLSLIVTAGSTVLLTSQYPLIFGAGLRQRILLGCYLFALSIFLCLLHNYLKLPGLATALLFLQGRDQAIGTWAKVFAYTCTALGIIAQVLTVVGYFLLVSALGSVPILRH